MKMSLETATMYAHRADVLLGRLTVRRDTLLGEMPRGTPGSLGYHTVADVVKHLEKREKQIAALRVEIAELESTDSDSAKLMQVVDRMGLTL